MADIDAIIPDKVSLTIYWHFNYTKLLEKREHSVQ
jgi:hypothetical protein